MIDSIRCRKEKAFLIRCLNKRTNQDWLMVLEIWRCMNKVRLQRLFIISSNYGHLWRNVHSLYCESAWSGQKECCLINWDGITAPLVFKLWTPTRWKVNLIWSLNGSWRKIKNPKNSKYSPRYHTLSNFPLW